MQCDASYSRGRSIPILFKMQWMKESEGKVTTIKFLTFMQILIGFLVLCSSLEDCLAAQGCAGVEILRKDLERTAAKLQGAQACEAHLRAEVACLKER